MKKRSSGSRLYLGVEIGGTKQQLCVGRADGTPEIALPLEGQVGATRRYVLGEVVVDGQ